MKKVMVLFSALVLFVGLTFAQTPQTQDKAAKPAEKKECPSKAKKEGCDEKTKAACAHSKDAKSCCAKGGKKDGAATKATDTKAPEKK